MNNKSGKEELKIWFDADLTKLMESAGVHTLEEKMAVCKVLAMLDLAWGELETYKVRGAPTSCFDYRSNEKFDKLMDGDDDTEDDDTEDDDTEDDDDYREVECDSEFENECSKVLEAKRPSFVVIEGGAATR